MGGAAWAPNGALIATLELPLPTPSNNVIKGMHFQAYRALRKEWAFLVWAALPLNLRTTKPLLPRAHLEIHRRCSGAGLDWDNAYGGLKPLLDCLVKASPRNPSGLGLILDDSPETLPLPPFMTQSTAKPGKGSTTVKIYSLVEAPGSSSS